MIKATSKRDRSPKPSPCVPIRYVRQAANLTLEEVSQRLQESTGRIYGKGTLSAVESGQRGASSELLEALEAAYELPAGSIQTEYQPRAPRRSKK